MTDTLKKGFNLLKDAIAERGKDRAAHLAAGVAYYAVFSLTPLLIVVIAIAGVILNEDTVQNQIISEIERAVGPESAEMIQSAITSAAEAATSPVAALISGVTILLGAVGLFRGFQTSLNMIWDVEPESISGLEGVLAKAKKMLKPVVVVFAAGFLLIAFILLNGLAAVLSTYFSDIVGNFALVSQLISLVVSLGVLTLLFAAIYRVLPEVDIPWSDLWVGAVITAVLFVVGQFFIGLYLLQSSTASLYGAASSLIVVFVWIYYSAQIFLFGAEITKVYARQYGSMRDTEA